MVRRPARRRLHHPRRATSDYNTAVANDGLAPTVPSRVPSLRAPHLVVIHGEDSTQHPLPWSGVVVVGRSRDCEIVVDHPSVSRRHVRIHIGATITVEDLGGTNGTRVAGRALAAGEIAALGPGAALELGEVLAVVRAETMAAAPSPVATVDLDHLIGRIAQSQINVLIIGETGVGKERVGDAIHSRSRRAGGPLVKVNCAAIPAALIESELFGHERGAFTGAITTKPGLIESADRGTLFLDEVGELDPAVQAKLLRVLEQREVQRVGALRPHAVDVRFVAATNRDLAAESASGHFRSDLYFRLDGISLRIPPLRERRGEIPALARVLLAEVCAREDVAVAPELSVEALAYLCGGDWPGNVRELRNAIDRALVLWSGGPLTPACFDAASELNALESPVAAGAAVGALRADVDDFERERILAVLDAHGGNQGRTAAALGISRRTLVSRLQAWGMTRSRRRP